MLGRQWQVEQEASSAREEQERLEQERLEQEVERQGLEGSLRAAEQAREALEHRLPTLCSERGRLQEQLTQVGVGAGQQGPGSGPPPHPHLRSPVLAVGPDTLVSQLPHASGVVGLVGESKCQREAAQRALCMSTEQESARPGVG